MSDEKKPGFFKRIFGFGKAAEPVAVPTPAPEVELPPAPVEAAPLRDEAADRIAAEIAEAKRLAEAERLVAAEAESQRLTEAERLAAARQQEEDARRARDLLEQQRREAEDREAARQLAEQQELAGQQAAREQAAKLEAERVEAARREAARLEAEKAEAARVEAASLEAASLEAAKLESARLEAAREAERAAEAAREAERTAAAATPRVSWWQKLKSGLSRTASSVSDGITGLFTKRKLDHGTLEELEDLLIQADLGIDVAARISAAVGKGRYDKEIAPDEVRAILADEVAKVLKPVALPLVVTAQKPFVLLMVGVNGSGKTTTIGKLASKLRTEGKSVMLAAGDTFRAAAIQQLRVWGERTGAPVVARDQGGDAAGLAFDAIKAARDQGTDVLMIDTAGRLQNRTELMAELEKVIRVIKKLDPTAPHATLLVLDATVGQNAISQVDIFGKQAGVTGLVMTKLDGTARGGILVALAERFKLPIHFIGVGEGVDDLEPFEATDFARAIAGLDQLGR